MSTGNVDSWAGNVADLGAVYPFVGTETPLVIVGVLFWIWWHINQMRTESRELEEEVREHANADSLNQILDNSDPSKR